MSARHQDAAHRLTVDEAVKLSGTLAAALAEAFTDEADAMSLATFCRRHGVSLQMYYKIAQQGLAPETFSIGTRVLVSKEAARRWRERREAERKASREGEATA